MVKYVQRPVESVTESSSKNSDDTANTGNRVQTAMHSGPIAQAQVGKKRKVAKEEVNVATSKEPKMWRHESARKVESQTLNTSDPNLNLQAMKKEGLQTQKASKEVGQDRKKKKLLDGVQVKSPVKHQELPIMQKSLDEHNTYKALEEEDLNIKAKKPSHSWSSKDEILLATYFLRDLKSGVTFPPKKNGNYWEDLCKRLKGRLDKDWSKDQIHNKYRRMKTRYYVLTQRMQSQNSKLPMYKGAEEEKLYEILQQIWGTMETQSPKLLHQKATDTPQEDDDLNEEALNEEDNEEKSDDKFSEPGMLAPISSSGKFKPKSNLVSASKFKALEIGLKSMEDAGNNVAGRNLLPVFQDNRHFPNRNAMYDTLQAANSRLIEGMQKSFVTTLKEEHSKVHFLVEKTLKQFEEKFRWLSELVTAFMPLAGVGTQSPWIWGGFSDGVVPSGMLQLEDSESTCLLQQQLLEQQSRETKVLVKRMQLLQRILHQKQEDLKLKLIRNSNS
ncbi:hypothetical protein O6H91_02G059100 [Diphasiastrum complanatum]|nr:hypothetical protein O6H91_02G059100 [Diphasiastrum complanatum]